MIVEEELPSFNPAYDVLVIPLEYDTSVLSAKSKISLQLLDEIGKVIRVSTLAKPAVIKIK